VSGLAIYFFVSNLYRVGQQALISKTIYSTDDAKKLQEQQRLAAEEQKKKGGPKKGFLQSMLGDAAPQLNKKPQTGRTSGNGKGTTGKPKPADKTGKTGDKTGDKAGDGDDGASRPPSAKGNGGRTTPPKPRSASARKKRKRK
jgi:hypothetical protein